MECYFCVRDVPPRLDTDRTKGTWAQRLAGGRVGWGMAGFLVPTLKNQWKQVKVALTYFI